MIAAVPSAEPVGVVTPLSNVAVTVTLSPAAACVGLIDVWLSSTVGLVCVNVNVVSASAAGAFNLFVPLTVTLMVPSLRPDTSSFELQSPSAFGFGFGFTVTSLPSESLALIVKLSPISKRLLPPLTVTLATPSPLTSLIASTVNVGVIGNSYDVLSSPTLPTRSLYWLTTKPTPRSGTFGTFTVPVQTFLFSVSAIIVILFAPNVALASCNSLSNLSST